MRARWGMGWIFALLLLGFSGCREWVGIKTLPPEGLFVDLTASQGSVPLYAYGVNYGPWMVVPHELAPLLDQGHWTFMRFPAGDWGERNEIKPYHLETYFALARVLRAEPSISVRFRGSTPQKAAALVRYVNIEQHYDVRYWSIGNEPDLYPEYDVDRFNREWRAFALAMREVDPNIRLIGPELHQFTDNPDQNPKDRHGRDWLRAFLAANGDLVDVVSIHRYPFPRCRTCPPATPEELRQSAREWDRIIPYLRQTVEEVTGRSLPVAVTEVNSYWTRAEGGETTPDSLYNALWWAEVLGRLIQQQVEIVAYFALQTSSGTGGWGLLASREVRPTFYVYVLYRNFGQNLVAVSTGPAISDQVSAFAARRSDGVLTLLLVHWGNERREVPLILKGGKPENRVTLWRLDEHTRGQAETLIWNPRAPAIPLTPRSVTLVEIPLTPP